MTGWANGNGVMAVRLPAARHVLAGLRQRMRLWLAEHGVSPEVQQRVVLATDEAVANAIEHGYRDNGERGLVDLTIRVEPGRVAVRVVDHGSWKPPDPAGGGNRGWGLTIIRSLAHRVRLVHRNGRTILTAYFPRPNANRNLTKGRIPAVPG